MIKKELRLLEEIISVSEDENNLIFNTMAFALFEDEKFTKAGFIEVVKDALDELQRISKSIEMEEKIKQLPDEKPCPVCNQTMYKKPLDHWRCVYDCSVCTRKEFYEDGEPLIQHD